MICNVAVADVQYGFNTTGSVSDFLACITESSQEPDGLSDQVYNLDELPKWFVRRYENQLYSGYARICIHRGRANRHSHQIVVPNSTAVQLLSVSSRGISTRRRLYPTTGQNTVLVVRVTSTAGEDPGLSDSLLQGAIFGTGSGAQSVSFVSQYAACSQGKLTMVPYTQTNVVNGIFDIQYSGRISGQNITGTLQTALNNLVIKSLGVKYLSQSADHILYCLPTGM